MVTLKFMVLLTLMLKSQITAVLVCELATHTSAQVVWWVHSFLGTFDLLNFHCSTYSAMLVVVVCG